MKAALGDMFASPFLYCYLRSMASCPYREHTMHLSFIEHNFSFVKWVVIHCWVGFFDVLRR